MILDSVIIKDITTIIADMFPEMSQDDVNCIIKYMGKHTDQWDAKNVKSGVVKLLPVALVKKDHTAFLVLGIIITVFINMILTIVLYLINFVYRIPFPDQNIDPVIF